MERVFDSILKQGRTLLFSFIEMLPVWILAFNFIAYVVYMGLEYMNYPEWTYNYILFFRQTFDIPLMALLMLVILSKNWREISKISFGCLCFLWLINTIYIFCNWDADIYFYAFCSIIYITFVILTVYVLINR